VKAMQVNCVTKNGVHSEINGKKWVDLIFVWTFLSTVWIRGFNGIDLTVEEIHGFLRLYFWHADPWNSCVLTF
jgi:hypothetical protein